MPGPVALTGATGFIGTALRRMLVQAGHPVHALTRRPMPPESGVTWFTGDLSDATCLQALVAGTDAVIHCAGTVRGKSRTVFEHVNRDGTAAVIEAVRRQPLPPRLLFISSLAARHPSLSWYAGSKAAAEALLAADDSGIPWTILRPTAVYGPGDREMRPLFQWMLRGILPTPQPAGSRFSLLHVDDLADAVRCWLDTPGAGHGVYELSDATPGDYDPMALAASAAKQLGKTVRVLPVPAWLLQVLARFNLVLSAVLRRTPMLTPGKVRELTHTDWRANPEPFMTITGWRPRVRFIDALSSGRLFFT